MRSPIEAETFCSLPVMKGGQQRISTCGGMREQFAPLDAPTNSPVHT